jgi:hypothetical protein
MTSAGTSTSHTSRRRTGGSMPHKHLQEHGQRRHHHDPVHEQHIGRKLVDDVHDTKESIRRR